MSSSTVRKLLALCLLGLLSGCPQGESGQAGAPRAGGERPSQTGGGQHTVVVASWNVRNFFDAVDDPYQDEVPTRARQAEKVRQLQRVISELDADFVALEEVENLQCLQQLNASLPQSYPQLGLIEGNDTMRGIDVAFLSRLPVSRVVTHRDRQMPTGKGVPRGYRFSRDCLEVGLSTEPPTTILINHLKAQVGDKKDSANKRRAQARAVADILQQVEKSHPDAIEVVMGDLNDEPDSWTLEPLTTVMHDPFRGWPRELRVTHRSRHGGSILDHILVSHDAAGRVGVGRVWKDLGKGTSDHDPISLEIRYDAAWPSPVSREWSES